MSVLPMSAIVLKLYVLRIEDQHLRPVLARRHDRHGRELLGVLDRLVRVDVAQHDGLVHVHLLGRALEAGRRAAGADLDLHPGVLALRHQRRRCSASCPCRRCRPATARAYASEWSDSGFQSVWMTTVDGQTPLRLVALSAAGGGRRGRRGPGRGRAAVAESSLLPQPAATSDPTASAISSAVMREDLVMGSIPWRVVRVNGCRVWLVCQRPTTRRSSHVDGQEHDDPQQGRQDHRRVQALGLELRRVGVHQHADARRALLEEEVADDRADHRRARGDPQAGEDRGHRGRQLQLDQPREPPAAGAG